MASNADYERGIAPVKETLFAQIREAAGNSPVDVLEIGMGTGPNLAFYASQGTTVTSLEPNPAMMPYAVKASEAAGMPPGNLRFVTGLLNEAPLPAAAFDFVVSTLVLCSVPSQEAALAEVKRVLKPGGRLIFIEHTIAQQPGGLRTLQRVLDPLQVLVAGCHLTRDTGRAIEAAGFADVALQHLMVDNAFVIAPHVAGTATL